MTTPYTNALAWARYMGSLGYHVHPTCIRLYAPGNGAALRKGLSGLPGGWQLGGLTDPEEIGRRWEQVGATGYLIACGPSEITAVDTDIKGDGETNWLAAGGTEHAAFLVASWSGGRHRYFRSTGACNTSGHPPGVDVRGVDGGLLGPGSVVLSPDGNVAGEYSVLAGLAVRENLGTEPANLAQIIGAEYRDKSSDGSAHDFFTDKRSKVYTRSSAINKCREKVETIAALDPAAVGRGYRKVILGAAYTAGGFLAAGLGTYEQHFNAIAGACVTVWGAVNNDDIEHIETGIEDGIRKPLVIRPDPEVLEPQQSPLAEDDRLVDLGPYLDGTYAPPEALVGARRSDGVFLLYPNRWHVLGGLTASGKTWFALKQAAAEILLGHVVVYLHFEESSPAGTLDRLRSLGLDGDTIKKRFIWMRCDRRWSAGELAAKLDRLDQPPTLVVLDGLNAAVAQHEGDVMRPESVGKYRELFVSPAAAVGAAVLSLGHPVKDRNRQDERHTFGSTAWLDEVDGCGFRLEASKDPIGRGRSGSSALYSVKDRYGQVERHGQAQCGREPGWFYLGQFVVDDAPDSLTASPFGGAPLAASSGTAAYLAAPKAKTADAEDSKPSASREAGDEAAVFDAVAAFTDKHGSPPSTAQIHATTPGIGKDRVNGALIRLTSNGELTSSPGPRGSTFYAISTSAGDQQDELPE